MPYNLNAIRRALVGGGQRTNLVDIQITLPTGADFILDGFNNPLETFDNTMLILCKAGSIPASSLGEIQVPYMGRKVKVPGDRTFETWDTTVMNDENFSIRHALERWSEAIEPHQGSVVAQGGDRRLVAGAGAASDTGLGSAKGIGLVRTYKHGGEPSAIYRFDGLWPMTIAAMDMDWDTTDTIQEYQVTWNYDWWTHATEGDLADHNVFGDSDFESI